MKRLLITCSLFALGSLSTSAFASCSEPSEPSCIDGYGAFDDDWSFNSCKSEVESFVSETEDYVRCLKRKCNEAVENANAAIEKFNCRAKGGSVC